MVKIAIAGGSSGVAQEIVDALVAREKHEILLLSRKDTPTGELSPGVSWVKTSYENVEDLAKILKGVHTVLSFIVVHLDPGNMSQKNLIDASVKAGVKRFAPSEWTFSSFQHQSWYAGKSEIREYLNELNQDSQILEYSLFQPGLFVNYLAHPYNTGKHIAPIETPIDFNNRRILTVDGGDDDRITLTTAQDVANVVAHAVEYEGEWPVVGGIKGSEVSIRQLIALGETLRGASARSGSFTVERLKAEDLKSGKVKSSWLPGAAHPAFSPEEFKKMSGTLVSGILLGICAGAVNVSDEWNRLLPDYEFTPAEKFLASAWEGKP